MTNQQELDARERAIHELEHEVERLRDDKNRLLSDLTVVIRERDELEAENERLRDTLSDEIRFSAERIARLQVERDGLREALERYGRCRSDCELVRALHRGENPTVCSCGYQAALDRNRE